MAITFGTCGHPLRTTIWLNERDHPLGGYWSEREPHCRLCEMSISSGDPPWMTGDAHRAWFVYNLGTEPTAPRERQHAWDEWRGREAEANAWDMGSDAVREWARREMEIVNRALVNVDAILAGCGYTWAAVPAWNERREVVPLQGVASHFDGLPIVPVDYSIRVNGRRASPRISGFVSV